MKSVKGMNFINSLHLVIKNIIKDHTVTVKRISEQSQHLPFRDDYHQILFSVEQLIWPVDSSYVTIDFQLVISQIQHGIRP